MEKTSETEVKTVAEGRALLEKYRTKIRQEAKTFNARVKVLNGNPADNSEVLRKKWQ